MPASPTMSGGKMCRPFFFLSLFFYVPSRQWHSPTIYVHSYVDRMCDTQCLCMRASILRGSVQGNVRRKCASCSPSAFLKPVFFIKKKLFREPVWLTREKCTSAGGM